MLGKDTKNKSRYQEQPASAKQNFYLHYLISFFSYPSISSARIFSSCIFSLSFLLSFTSCDSCFRRPLQLPVLSMKTTAVQDLPHTSTGNWWIAIDGRMNGRTDLIWRPDGTISPPVSGPITMVITNQSHRTCDTFNARLQDAKDRVQKHLILNWLYLCSIWSSTVHPSSRHADI